MSGSSGRTAIVTGAAGQDGYFLVQRLLAEGTTVHATVRARSRAADLEALSSDAPLSIHELDLGDTDRYVRLIDDAQPDEFYNCAGQSSVSESFRDPAGTWRANADAVQGILEAIRVQSPALRFYQSSSTDMFGSIPGSEILYDEGSQFRPQSPYAAAKAAAHMLCDAYRRGFDLRIACGILSNHESRRRPASFLTSKVADHVRSLRRSPAEDMPSISPLRVGNLAVRREWGFAPDYVDGMIRICRQIGVRADVLGTTPEADVGSSYRDYVLGSGHLHAVWELVDRAFDLGGFPLDWDRTSPDPVDWTARHHDSGALAVVVDPVFVRHSDPAVIGTNTSMAREELGWRPRTDLDTFLMDMIARDRDLPNDGPGRTG